MAGAMTLTGDQLFRCPNSGRIIIGHVSDDKVRCTCGKANPKLRHETVDSSGFVHHLKAFLEDATAQELINQRREDAIRNARRQRG